jgi:hypothetical protein
MMHPGGKADYRRLRRGRIMVRSWRKLTQAGKGRHMGLPAAAFYIAGSIKKFESALEQLELRSVEPLKPRNVPRGF